MKLSNVSWSILDWSYFSHLKSFWIFFSHLAVSVFKLRVPSCTYYRLSLCRFECFSIVFWIWIVPMGIILFYFFLWACFPFFFKSLWGPHPPLLINNIIYTSLTLFPFIGFHHPTVFILKVRFNLILKLLWFLIDILSKPDFYSQIIKMYNH